MIEKSKSDWRSLYTFVHSMNNLYVREPCQSPEVCPDPVLPNSFADVAAGVDKNIGEGQSNITFLERIIM